MNYADQSGLFNVVQAMKRFAANPHDDAEVLAAGAAARRSSPPKARRSAERHGSLTMRKLARAARASSSSLLRRSRCGAEDADARRRASSRSRRSTPVAVDAAAASERAGRRGALQDDRLADRRRCQRRRVPRRCRRYLQASFPKAHAHPAARGDRQVRPALHLGRQRRAGAPIALMAHQDVVPIAPGTEGDWQVAPFAGDAEGRLRLGPRRVGRQGQPDVDHGSGRAARRPPASSRARRSTSSSARTRKSAASAARRRSPRCSRSAACGCAASSTRAC